MKGRTDQVNTTGQVIYQTEYPRVGQGMRVESNCSHHKLIREPVTDEEFL